MDVVIFERGAWLEVIPREGVESEIASTSRLFYKYHVIPREGVESSTMSIIPEAP